MDFRLPVLLCLTTFALGAGCRQNNAHRELLERELRFQEDRIYELEAELEEARRELSRFGDVPGSSSFSSSGRSTFDDRPFSATPDESRPPTNVHAPPNVELPSPTETRKEAAPPYAVPPVILPPDPNVPEGLPSRSVTPSESPSPPPPPNSISPPSLPESEPKAPQLKTMSSPKFLSPSLKTRVAGEPPPDFSQPESPPPSVPLETRSPSTAAAVPPPPNLPPIAAVPLPVDEKVASLALGKRTGGLNLDGRPGDEGVFVVVEMRTARGETIAGDGELSIALLDPAVAGEGARYARWDFTGSDAAALFRPASAEGPAGTYLELAWPDAAPQHARLKLFVRLRTPDGRQLQIDRDVTVELPLGATTIAPPGPFTPTLAPPRVTPVGAPTPDEHPRTAPPGLNWGRRSTAPPAALAPVPTPVPTTGSVYESTPVEGPSLGPALLPAGPR